MIGRFGIKTIKLNLIRSNNNVKNSLRKFDLFKIKMSRGLQLLYFERLFLPKCLPNFDFKRNNFAYKFQKYSFYNRYHTTSVSELLFRSYTNSVKKYFADFCGFFFFFFALTQKFEQKSEVFWFLRLLLQEKKVSMHKLTFVLTTAIQPQNNCHATGFGHYLVTVRHLVRPSLSEMVLSTLRK